VVRPVGGRIDAAATAHRQGKESLAHLSDLNSGGSLWNQQPFKIYRPGEQPSGKPSAKRIAHYARFGPSPLAAHRRPFPLLRNFLDSGPAAAARLRQRSSQKRRLEGSRNLVALILFVERLVFPNRPAGTFTFEHLSRLGQVSLRSEWRSLLQGPPRVGLPGSASLRLPG